jgi:hypothetical protein
LCPGGRRPEEAGIGWNPVANPVASRRLSSRRVPHADGEEMPESAIQPSKLVMRVRFPSPALSLRANCPLSELLSAMTVHDD